MSRLDDLIAELCPDGVTFFPLKTVCNISKGVQFNKSNMNDDGTYPVINGGINPSGYIEQYNQNENTITISQGGASAGYVNWMDRKFWAGAHCYILSPGEQLENRYLFHFIKSKEYKLQECQYGAGIPALGKATLEEMRIPVPPLEVQREIVRVLDNFTFLSAELSAELSARRKQYEYYRNQMLSFDTDVQRIPMGDLFEFRNGLSKGKEFFGSGTPFIRYTDVYNHRSLRKDDIDALVECTPDELRKLKVSRGDVLFTRTSETAEDVGWSSVMLDDMDNCVFNGFTIKASPKTDLLWPEYCAFCFATDSFRNYVTKHCAFTTRASLTGSTIADYKLAVPSLAIQKRIAEVLDNFEKICNDLGIGLPAEIEARQKQYEYYRDLLLTFAETGTTIARQTDRQTDRQAEIALLQYVFGYALVELREVVSKKGSGATPNKANADYYYGGTIPWIRTQDVRFNNITSVDSYITEQAVKETAAKWIPENCVIVAISGASAGRCAINKIRATTNQHCLNLQINEEMASYRYVYYCVMSNYDVLISKKQGARGDLNSTLILETVIPLPSIDDQYRIVETLDRFDKLCNDLSSGLPAEIEARQKQYEYYRDKLLTFKEKA